MTVPGGRLSLRLPDYVLVGWKEVIPARHSRRTYLPDTIDEQVLARLEDFCSRLPARGRARVEVVRSVRDDVFRGIVGSYGRVNGAPSGLIVIGLNNVSVVESVGYVGEAAVLEATRLGLDTCWVGGFFEQSRAAEHVSLRTGERIWAVSPLGYATASPRLAERLMKKAVRSHRRVPRDQLVTAGDPSGWPQWAQEGLRLARLAPSAVNRQPWRFSLESTQTMKVAECPECRAYQIPKRLDCGIAMLHFEVGARCAGAGGEWEHASGSEVSRYVLA